MSLELNLENEIDKIFKEAETHNSLEYFRFYYSKIMKVNFINLIILFFK